MLGVRNVTVNILGTNKELYIKEREKKTVEEEGMQIMACPLHKKTSRPIWLQTPKAKVRREKKKDYVFIEIKPRF